MEQRTKTGVVCSHRRSHLWLQNSCLANIAKNYGITSAEAYAEVTDCGRQKPEHLLEYDRRRPERAATSL